MKSFLWCYQYQPLIFLKMWSYLSQRFKNVRLKILVNTGIIALQVFFVIIQNNSFMRRNAVQDFCRTFPEKRGNYKMGIIIQVFFNQLLEHLDVMMMKENIDIGRFL